MLDIASGSVTYHVRLMISVANDRTLIRDDNTRDTFYTFIGVSPVLTIMHLCMAAIGLVMVKQLP